MNQIIVLLFMWLSVVKSERDGIGVVRELWSDVHGSSLQNLIADSRFPHQPTFVTFLQTFDAPTDTTLEETGQRIKGYFLAPISGGYRFFSSCGGTCEVFLGFNGMEGESNKIIKQHRPSDHNQFFNSPDQESRKVALEKGKRYYLEAIGKKVDGADHLSVGVELPNGKKIFPITSNMLRRFKDSKQDDSNNRRHDFDTIVELGSAKIIVPRRSNKKIRLETETEENESGVARDIKEKNALTVEIGIESNGTTENESTPPERKSFSKENFSKNPKVKVEEVSFDSENFHKFDANNNKKKASPFVEATSLGKEKTFSYKTFISKNKMNDMKNAEEKDLQKLKHFIVKTNTGNKNDDDTLSFRNKLTAMSHKIYANNKSNKSQNKKTNQNSPPTEKVASNNIDTVADRESQQEDNVMKKNPGSTEAQKSTKNNLSKKDGESSLLPTETPKLKNKISSDYTAIKREKSAVNSASIKKPDIIKVEFIPDEATIEIINGSKIANPKKAGTVRVQFIPGESVEKEDSKTPKEDTKKEPAPKTEEEEEDVAKEFENVDDEDDEDNEEETMDDEIIETKSKRKHEKKNKKKKEDLNEKTKKLSDENGQTRHKKKHKSIKGYEANPILPEKLPIATTPGGSNKQVSLSIQSPLNTGGFTTVSKNGMEGGARNPIPVDGIENALEEHVDPPLTMLGEKFKDLIPPEQKMMIGNNLENVEKGNNSPLPRTGSDPDRVFVGGDIVPSSPGQGPHQEQPDPTPTHNAPSDPTGAQGPIVNPVAGHLLSALSQNAVTPEEALQMMNDFISGNQDMQKAASIMDGMLGKISAQRRRGAKLLGEDNHHFIDDPNKINSELEPGYADPSLMKMFPERFSGPPSGTMLNEPLVKEAHMSTDQKHLGVEPFSPTRDRNVADNLDEMIGNRQGSYINPTSYNPNYVAGNRNDMPSLNLNFENGHKSSQSGYNSPGQNNNFMEPMKAFDNGYINPLFDKSQAIEPSNEIPNYDQNDYNDFHKDPNFMKSFDESSTYNSRANTETNLNADLNDNSFHRNKDEFPNVEAASRTPPRSNYEGMEQYNLPNLMGDLASGNIHVDMNAANGNNGVNHEVIHNDMQQATDGVGNDWKSNQNIHQERLGFQQSDQNFARKFLTPNANRVKTEENENLKPKGEKNKHDALADMYTDSIFPEDFEDIQSLRGDLQGKTLTSYDQRTLQEKQIKAKKGSFMHSELKASYPLEALALGGPWGAGETRSTVPKSKIPTGKRAEGVLKKIAEVKGKLMKETKKRGQSLHRERRDSSSKQTVFHSLLIPRRHMLYNLDGLNETPFSKSEGIIKDSTLLQNKFDKTKFKLKQNNVNKSRSLIGGLKNTQSSNIKFVSHKINGIKSNDTRLTNSFGPKNELTFSHYKQSQSKESLGNNQRENSSKNFSNKTAVEKISTDNKNLSMNSITAADISSDTSFYPDKTDWADIQVDNAEELKSIESQSTNNEKDADISKTVNPMLLKSNREVNQLQAKNSQAAYQTQFENTQKVNQTQIKNKKAFNVTKNNKQQNVFPIKNDFTTESDKSLMNSGLSTTDLLQTNLTNEEIAPLDPNINDTLTAGSYEPITHQESIDSNQPTEVSDKGLRALMAELKDVLYRLHQYKMKAKAVHQHHHQRHRSRNYLNSIYQGRSPFVGEALSSQALSRLQGIDRGEIESAIASLNEPVQRPVVKDMDIENYLQEVYDPGMRGFEGTLGRIGTSPTIKDDPISSTGAYQDMEELSSFDNGYENSSVQYSKRETLPRVQKKERK